MATYQTVGEFTSGERLASADLEAVRANVDLVNAQSAYPFRSLLYNGAMQVAQRGTSQASITTTGYYTADRWQTGCTTLGTWTQSVETDAPTGYGLAKSLKMLCTTADASPAASDTVFVQQSLEGYDVQRLAKGTASARTMVLTFWVKSNVTGTYTVLIYDNDNNRSVSKTYTVTASATWERKEITIPADTTGAFDNDANASLLVRWNLGLGSTFTSGTLQTTWGTYANSTVGAGQTNVASATNNYWQVTGVQLETGSVSTPYEYLPYGDELRRCQRYYYRVGGDQIYQVFGQGYARDGSTVYSHVPLPTTMRIAPTSAEVSSTSHFQLAYDLSAVTSITGIGVQTNWNSRNTAVLYLDKSLAYSTGKIYVLQANNTLSAYLGFSAEL